MAHTALQPATLLRTSPALAAALLSMLASAASGVAQPPDPCSWSPVWKELIAPFEGLDRPGAKITEPRRIKGSVGRPPSPISHMITGVWVVETVVDEKGKVRDAKIIKTPQIDPPWRQYEAGVLGQIRKLEFSPLLRDGRPWPICISLTGQDRPG